MAGARAGEADGEEAEGEAAVKLVYIAGPYRGDVANNIARARESLVICQPATPLNVGRLAA